MDKKGIALIEKIAANAWPPEVQQDYLAWHLKYSRGITRRGNSVLPLYDEGGMGLDEKVDFVENYYSEKGQPAIYQMTSAAKPSDLHENLKTRGYQDRFHTQVKLALTKEVLRKTDAQFPFQATISRELNADWFSFYTENNQYSILGSEVRKNILQKIPGKTAYVLLKEGETIVSVGLAVKEDNYMGIFCMISLNSQRRRGAATQTIHALAEWANNNSVDKIYLQVMEDNHPALSLYEKSGFSKIYQYWYSEK